MTLAIMRANNPGALRPHPGEGWLGNDGVIELPGGAYQSFSSMAWGIRAALRNLHTYRTKHELHTPRGIIHRWAPPSDDNPTDAYAANVARGCGVGLDEPIPFTFLGTWKLITAIMRQETGGAHIPAAHIAAAFRIMAKEEERRGDRGHPEVYTAPVAVAPIQRTRQEAERIPRRGWGIIGLITGAFYAARDALFEIGVPVTDALGWLRDAAAGREIFLIGGALLLAGLWAFHDNRKGENDDDIPPKPPYETTRILRIPGVPGGADLDPDDSGAVHDRPDGPQPVRDDDGRRGRGGLFRRPAPRPAPRSRTRPDPFAGR